MAERDLTKDTLEVSHGDAKYVFAIPTLADEIKLGLRERNIRREMDPASSGDVDGLDVSTILLVRAAAQFELLLRSASVAWPYTPGAGGAPVVDYRRFPSDKVQEVVQVSLDFQAALNRFRGGGVRDGDAEGGEVVAGQ